MPAISRRQVRTSLLAVTCLLTGHAQAAVQTGSFTFDGQPVNYHIFTGTDEAFFQSFKAGGTLTDFENLPGQTAYNATSYDNNPIQDPANLVSPGAPINGIFYSSGGQTPGNPTSGMPAPTVWVNLDGIAGAHSGSHVLAPSDFSAATVQFSNSFFSFGVPTADKFSRIGWWTNPLMSTAAGTPNIHVVDSAGMDDDNILADNGIAVSIQPGEFFAVSFDKPIIQEAEFAVAPDHYTLDDVVYARDNKIVFAPIPEPSTWLMLAAGVALLFVRWGLKRKSQGFTCAAA
jgi:PEP-CTERM motif